MTFDDQAKTFETRTGLSESTCQAIVKTAIELAQVKADAQVVEVGAGTGQIGQWFASKPVKYLGFDLSQGMLEQFQQHLNEQQNNTKLVQADANQLWPVVDGNANLIFSSRTLHLLNLEHVVNECWRVAQPQGATVIMGSVQREKTGVKNQMRKQMQTLLAQETLRGRQKNKLLSRVVELFTKDGAKEIKPVEVSRWKVVSTPRQSLESWRGKANLAGIELDEEIKRNVLDRLQAWAEEKFGNLDQPVESEEMYVLQGVRLN